VQAYSESDLFYVHSNLSTFTIAQPAYTFKHTKQTLHFKLMNFATVVFLIADIERQHVLVGVTKFASVQTLQSKPHLGSTEVPNLVNF